MLDDSRLVKAANKKQSRREDENKNMKIIKIQKEDIASVWYEIRELLKKPMIRSSTIERFPLDVLLSSLVSGEKQAWAIFDEKNNKTIVAFVTEKVNYPTGMAINLFLLGGENIEAWRESLTICLFNYAKESGAKWLDTYCRRGFSKILSDLNFTEESTHFSISI